jgi:hypothetical protein
MRKSFPRRAVIYGIAASLAYSRSVLAQDTGGAAVPSALTTRTIYPSYTLGAAALKVLTD